MTLPLELGSIEDPNIRQALEVISLAFTDLRGLFFVGSRPPNGVVTASPPAIYLNRSGGAGTTIVSKRSGTATRMCGWVAK
jgi:hypothetical protein